MLRRSLAFGAVTSAIATATVLVAPAAEAKPREDTITCHTEHHIDFNSDGSVMWEGTVTICTKTFPSGSTIEKTYDDKFRIREICTGRKGRIFQDCTVGDV
jgi:hypothetical protein